jgi:Flp pilus assembly pilin Flp
MESRMDASDRAPAAPAAASATRRLLRDARGATAIEYSVVAAGIAVAVAGAIRILGANVLTNLYSQLAGLFG